MNDEVFEHLEMVSAVLVLKETSMSQKQAVSQYHRHYRWR